MRFHLFPGGDAWKGPYRSGIVNSMKKTGFVFLETWDPAQAAALTLPFFNAIHIANMYPGETALAQTRDTAMNIVGMRPLEGIAAILIEGNVWNVDRNSMRKEFYRAVHKYFAWRDDGLRNVLIRFESIEIDQPFAYFSRALFYVLSRSYFPEDANLTRVANFFLSGNARWDEVPYTLNPQEMKQHVDEKILSLQDVFLAYGMRFLRFVYGKLTDRSLLPSATVKNGMQVQAVRPTRNSYWKYARAFKYVIIPVVLQEPNQFDRKWLAELYSKISVFLETAEDEFNPFYTRGLRSAIEESELRAREAMTVGVLVNELDRKFKDSIREEAELVGFPTPDVIFYGKNDLIASIRDSYELDDEVQPRAQSLERYFFMSSAEVLREKDPEASRNLRVLFGVFRERLGEGSDVIIARNSKELQLGLRNISKEPKGPVAIIYFDSAKILFTTLPRQANTNLYLVHQRMGEPAITVLNVEGTLSFPDTVEKVTTAVQRHFDIPTGREENPRVFAISFSRAAGVDELSLVQNPLLYVLWYAECIARGLLREQAMPIGTFFGEEKIKDWILRDYFLAVRKTMDSLQIKGRPV